MFYDACRAGGCSVAKSLVLYSGVTFGRWAAAFSSSTGEEELIPKSIEEEGLAESAEFSVEDQMAEEMFDEMLADPEMDMIMETEDLDALDALIEKHKAMQTERRGG